jgi:hypothetical protein
MSYDIRLVDETGETVLLDQAVDLRGGTYAAGGTHECWLNVTYNYGAHFRRVFGPLGIRSIYGIKARFTVVPLEEAIAKLDTDVDLDDYWNPTEGNARRALEHLLALAKAAPEGRWAGD